MKKKILSIMAILAIASLTACTSKPEEVTPVPEVNNNTQITENVTKVPEKSEAEIAKESLISGKEWKPTTGYYTSGDETLEYPITSIYGKYAGVGGATFHEDNTFTKFVGVFEAEEEADKTGTYEINTDNHTITFNYSKGEVVTAQYKKAADGKVESFMYPEENVSVQFEPSHELTLKDNNQEARYQIELAMKNQIKEAYGDDVTDSKIYIEKIYTYGDEEKVEALKEMNLTNNEVAFEVKYELKPAEGADINSLTAATGVYDEESGWVKEKFNLGILRPSGKDDGKYVITDFGTGW